MNIKKRINGYIFVLLALGQLNRFNLQSYALSNVSNLEDFWENEINRLCKDIKNGKVFHLSDGSLVNSKGKLIYPGCRVDVEGKFRGLSVPLHPRSDEILKNNALKNLREDIKTGKVFRLPNGYLIRAEGKLIYPNSDCKVDENNKYEDLEVPLHPCLEKPGEFGYDENCGVEGYVIVYSRHGYDAYDLTGHYRKLNKIDSAPLLHYLPNWTDRRNRNN